MILLPAESRSYQCVTSWEPLGKALMSREVDGTFPNGNVIDFWDGSRAQRETLCGKLEWEKAHQPQVGTMSMEHPERGCHRPFQKARGLDQEISRKAFLRPCPQLRPATDRRRLCWIGSMILRPCLSLPDSGFLWKEGT